MSIEYIPKSVALGIVSRLCTDYSAAYAEISAERGITIVKCRECRWSQADDLDIMYCHRRHVHVWVNGFCDYGCPKWEEDGHEIQKP